MTDYYLSPSGSATSPYDTWEKAANNLNQILSLSLTGENTIYVAEGTYSGSDNYTGLTDVKYSDLSVIGRGSAEKIVFDPGTPTSCYVDNTSITNVLFENITIKNDSLRVIWVNNGNNITFTNCNIVATENHTGHIIRTSNASTVVTDRCRIWTDSYQTAIGINIQNDSLLNVYSCQIYSPNGSPTTLLYHATTANVNIYNSILAKSKNIDVSHAGAGNLIVINSIIVGAYWGYGNYPTIHRGSSAGITSIKNCVVLPSTYYPTNFFASGTTTENVIQSDPHLKLTGARGFIIPRVDDNTNLSYAQSLASLLSEYGYKGSFFLNVHEDVLDVLSDLRNLIQNGIIEVAPHTRSHTKLTYNHALYFEYNGTDTNPTVSLDSSRIIHLATDGDDSIDIDTTQDNADTLGEIISNFSGTKNWTISKSTTDGQSASSIGDLCKAESLAEMAATAAPCDIDFLKETDCTDGNCSGFYKSEIYDSRIELTNMINNEGDITDPQTGQTYKARTFVPPYGAGDANVVEALRTSGYLGAAGLGDFTSETLPYNVFKIGVIPIGNLITEGDEEQTTKNAELFAINVAICGLPVTVLSHDDSQATMEEWRWILNGFKQAREHYDIEITSLQLVIEELKSLGTYDSSTGDIDICWPMPSFQLQSTSPCINMGCPIRSISSDIDGNIRPSGGQIDIGAYEYQQNLYDGEYVWYVRPSGGSYGYENGKTYANAWDGFSNIVWNQASGMYHGDTLYICGTHNESFAVEMSGLNSTPVYIRGDHPSYKGIIDVQNSATRCVYISDKDNIIASGLVVRGGTQEGIYVYTNSSVNNIQVRGASVGDVGQYGLYLYTTNASAAISDIVFENCSVASIGRHGIYWYCNPNSTPEFEASAVKIKSCKITNFSTADNDYRYGINITYGREALIEDCNVASNFTGRTYASGIGLVYTHNGSVRRNIVHNIDYMGIRDYKNYNASDESTYILNNRVNDVTYGVKCTGRTDGSSLNAFIEGNTVFDTGNAAISAESGFKGTRVINNIVASSAGYGISFDTTSISSILVSNNLLFDCANLLNNCTDDKLATADPQFTSPSTLDFTVASTSPAINSGYRYTILNSDYAGNIRPSGGQFDRGAYEYQQNYLDGEIGWFVRPSGGSYGEEDGTSYSNSWNGFDNIVWNQANGVMPGDNLVLCGTHNENFTVGASGEPGNPIVIRGDYSKDSGYIDTYLASSHSVYAIDKNYFTIRDLEVSGSPNSGNSGVVINNTSGNLSNVGGITIASIVSKNNRYGIFYSISNASVDASNINIRNCIIASVMRTGIRISGSITDFPNIVGETGIKISNCSVADWSKGGNSYYHGIHLYAVKNCIVEECTVHDPDASSTTSVGIYLSRTGSSVVDRNIIHDGLVAGIGSYKPVFASTTSPSTVRSNVVYNIGVDGYDNSIYVSNTSVATIAKNFYVENNTIYYGAGYGISVTGSIDGVTITNNIIASMNTTYHSSYAAIYVSPVVSNASFDSNVVFNYGNISGGTDNNLATQDPEFFNATARNFKLRQISPYIKSGSSTTSATQDILGRPFVQASPPIGAYDSRVRTHRKNNNFRRWFTP